MPPDEPRVEVTLRIPGLWQQPDEVDRALPIGYRLVEGKLHLPDEMTLDVGATPADDEFADLFRNGCQYPPSDEDQQKILNYKTNVLLSGPGGSMGAAKRMLDAGRAIIHAGGAGVFVDNSGMAHGSDDWLALAGQADDGGAFWAFVATVGTETTVYSIGMHVLGYRDAMIPRTGNDEQDYLMLNEFLGYSYRSGRTIHDGDLMGDEHGPQFRIRAETATHFPPDAPLHNPFGQWRLEAALHDN